MDKAPARVLDTLRAHPALTPISTEEAAHDIAAAAEAAKRPQADVDAALGQLAAKVAGRRARATVDAAVSFVLSYRERPGLARRGPEERAPMRYAPPDRGPLPPPPDKRAVAARFAAMARACGVGPNEGMCA